MLMADTMSIFFVILGMLLAFCGLWLLCRGLWPEAVAAAADRCGKRLWSSFLAGLPVTIVMIVLTKTLFNMLGPVGKIAGDFDDATDSHGGIAEVHRVHLRRDAEQHGDAGAVHVSQAAEVEDHPLGAGGQDRRGARLQRCSVGHVEFTRHPQDRRAVRIGFPNDRRLRGAILRPAAVVLGAVLIRVAVLPAAAVSV